MVGRKRLAAGLQFQPEGEGLLAGGERPAFEHIEERGADYQRVGLDDVLRLLRGRSGVQNECEVTDGAGVARERLERGTQLRQVRNEPLEVQLEKSGGFGIEVESGPETRVNLADHANLFAV